MVKVSVSPEVTHESVAQHLEKVIEGTSLHFDDENLHLVSDLNKIKKAYKLGPGNVKSAPKAEVGKGSQNDFNKSVGSESRDLERTILGLMALRGS